jgi:hypothetical protein
MHLTGLCMHVLHALPHDVTGRCMQLLLCLCCFDFVSDIPLSTATLDYYQQFCEKQLCQCKHHFKRHAEIEAIVLIRKPNPY